jgi:hypothetical protein
MTPHDNPRLISCTGCGQSVSKKARHCPRCGCPSGSVDAKPQVDNRQEVFDMVFRCVAQAVRDMGYALQGLDKPTGTITFMTGISWWSFGQYIQLFVVDQGDCTFAVEMKNSYVALTDWGEGKRIGKKIVARASELLEAEGLSGVLR